MNTTIGIKKADRTYYPVLERGDVGKKRLVLTTVKDDQTSVQIDVYENSGTEMDTARYVGSLLIENIESAASGVAEVELILGLDSDHTLTAGASEGTSGERQSLSVGLESLTGDEIYDIPEFELEDDLDVWDTSGDEVEPSASESLSDDFDAEEDYGAVGIEEQEAIAERKRPVMFALFIVFGVAAIVLIMVLLFRVIEGPKIPPLRARGTETNVADSDVDNSVDASESQVSEVAAGGGPASTPERTSSVKNDDTVTAPSIAGESLGGSWYWIRWGDTLWGLSSSFYRNPWLYNDIAKRNNIVNPDLIYAGDRIFIPQK